MIATTNLGTIYSILAAAVVPTCSRNRSAISDLRPPSHLTNPFSSVPTGTYLPTHLPTYLPQPSTNILHISYSTNLNVSPQPEP
eukprot:scaffold10267_cov270-Chaetoceros_neogracile.AAC.19